MTRLLEDGDGRASGSAGAFNAAKCPGFAVVAVLTPARGLTVNATIFSMASKLLLDPALDRPRVVESRRPWVS